MILSISVLGLVILVNRDTFQTTVNEKSDQITNAAETDLQRLIEDYGSYEINLADLILLPECQSVSSDSQLEVKVECLYSDSEYSTVEVTREIEITDMKKIDDLKLAKDENVAINLQGYFSGLDFYWEGSSAIELTLVYKDLNGKYRSEKDVFDSSGVYSSLEGVNPYSARQFNFDVIPGVSDSNKSFRLNLNSISKDYSLANYEFLVITNRTKSNNSINLNVEPTDPSSFAFQQRRFISTGYDESDIDTPVIQLESILPLFPQVDSIFDYAILSGSGLSV